MNGNNSPQSRYEKIKKLIKSSRFNEAFMLLKNSILKYNTLSLYSERLNKEEATYKYLLEYLSQGHTDPSRNEMLQQIADTLYNVNDALKRAETLIDSSDIYSSTRRISELRHNNFHSLFQDFSERLKEDTTPEGEIKISRAQAVSLNELFNYVWTLHESSSQEYDNIAETLDDPSLPDYYKALMISALIAANISYFNPVSFALLINQYDDNLPLNLKARLITGILLIALINAERIVMNINLRSQLVMAMQDADLQDIINQVLLFLIKTFDTMRIDKKMREEVIPGLMKIDPKIIEKMRNMASESENFLSDENPNWEEMFENSEIGDKLQEMNELQLEGADVMVTAFSNLKSFPFFDNISNWFLPFVESHYDIAELELLDEKNIVDNLREMMCDSDIYSFLLSIKSMPEDKRHLMLNNLSAQMQEVKEVMGNQIAEDTEDQKLKKRINRNLQDIYRFYKFYKKRNGLNDPFSQPLLSRNILPIKDILGLQPESIRLASEFYFKNKYYDEAADLFELSEKLIPEDYSVWEKIGYSHDMMKRYEEATKWYKKTELVDQPSSWLLKKIALSLKNSGKYSEALDYYERALAIEPENFHLLMSLSQCYLETGDYENARKHLYHAQYLKPEKPGPNRALAWTELNSLNFEKALDLYKKIIEQWPGDNADVLNMAHTQMAMGRFGDALRNYRRFVEMSEGQDITILLLALKEDAKLLKTLGIDTKDLRLIVDTIRYEI